MTLTLKNTTDLTTILTQSVTDKETKAGYYTFDINLPSGIPDGEYEYTLKDGDNTLSTGIVTISGKVDFDKQQFNKTIQYEQYETE